MTGEERAVVAAPALREAIRRVRHALPPWDQSPGLRVVALVGEGGDVLRVLASDSYRAAEASAALNGTAPAAPSRTAFLAKDLRLVLAWLDRAGEQPVTLTRVGDRLRLEVDGRGIELPVGPTGSWDRWAALRDGEASEPGRGVAVDGRFPGAPVGPATLTIAGPRDAIRLEAPGYREYVMPILVPGDAR